MTGDTKWFASLCKASGDENITFGNDAQGCIVAKGIVRVNENCLLKDVALVSKLSYNLISVSQLLDEGFEVRFKKSASRILDSTGDLVFGISRVGKIFGADFGVLFSSSP